ncbi:MAG: ribbon-helix-helix protein, CopG family [Gemmatimonadetes bacterium]|jgi:RHH-type transcriptional regulator, rel operon repressor / antitoxin RelB|nr:ribbon-helix-helix protein, CopG family [Gemmatimonadota bacterium]
MSVALSVRLPNGLAAELDEVAAATERSRSYLVQKAIEAYLAEQADLQVALDRLNDASDPRISLDAMRAELDL